MTLPIQLPVTLYSFLARRELRRPLGVLTKPAPAGERDGVPLDLAVWAFVAAGVVFLGVVDRVDLVGVDFGAAFLGVAFELDMTTEGVALVPALDRAKIANMPRRAV